MKDMTMFTDKQLEVMATQGDARSVHAKRELEKRKKTGKGQQGVIKDKRLNGTPEGKIPARKTRKTTTKAADKAEKENN